MAGFKGKKGGTYSKEDTIKRKVKEIRVSNTYI